MDSWGNMHQDIWDENSTPYILACDITMQLCKVTHKGHFGFRTDAKTFISLCDIMVAGLSEGHYIWGSESLLSSSEEILSFLAPI